MNRAMEILGIVLPVFLVLGLGVLCRSRRIVSREGIRAIRWTAVNLTLPASLLLAVAQADYSGRRILIPLWIFLVCLAALGLGRLASKALRLPGKMTPYLCTGFEAGMLGYALYPLAFGPSAPFAIVDLGQVVFVFTVYKLLLSGARDGRRLLREAVSSPAIWGVALGLILGVSGLYRRMEPSGLQALFDKTLTFISAPTGFMILLTIGYDLEPARIEWRRTLGVAAVRVAIMALLAGATLLADRFLFGGVMELPAVVMLFVLPAPFVISAFSKEEEESAFLSSALSVMTLLTIGAFVLMTVFLR